jgi:hypothetical protein
MSIILYASLPNEVLNLIWTHIDPLLKYSLNKENFNKYYSCRYDNIHYNHYNNNNNNDNANIIYNFNNYNYYYYLLKHDLLFFCAIVLNLYVQKLVSGELVIKKHNTIYYKNLRFYSLIDFFYYYSNISNISNNTHNSNNKKCKDLIIEIISKYNLTHLIKKIHKNNVNKNIRWNI